MGIATQKARHSHETLGQNGISLMGHGRVTTLLRCPRFPQLTHIAAHHLPESPRYLFDSSSCNGNRREKSRMSIPLKDLCFCLSRTQLENFQGFRFYFGIEFSINANCARNIALV